ncbi:MAG: alpha-hydroxy-acid oxidizing protein [Archaeoglobus sp.]|nr:alpha-hydroxy-acid oxidizing protein [Archaeoglobus sp.]
MSYNKIIQAGLKKLESLNEVDRINRYLGEAGGVESGYTSSFNREYFNRIRLKMRLLEDLPDLSKIDTRITLFRQQLEMPIMSGAISGMANLASKPLKIVAEAMKELGTLAWMGIGSKNQLVEMIDTGAKVIKISKPYKATEKIIEELSFAEKAGVIAAGIDIDFFYGGKIGDKLILESVTGPKKIKELEDVASTLKVPFIVKGILSESDAKKASNFADVIVVSNHGAAVLDYAAHPLEVLPNIVKNVQETGVTILVDSGFRRGTDVLKGLALGAKGVLLGTATMLGLAADGKDGIVNLFNAINEELRRTMAICGCKTVSEIAKVAKDILVF